MLREFLKINNPRQQRKYLDKQAIILKKTGLDEEKMNLVIELAEYLDSIHYWAKYESLFDETISLARSMKKEKLVDEKIAGLSNAELAAFQSNLSILTGYEKDVVVDAYDANKKDLGTILIKGSAYSDKERYASIQDAKTLLIDAMECHGSLQVKYFGGFRVLKRIKL